MLDRLLLIALTPLALAGGTATSWVQSRWDGVQPRQVLPNTPNNFAAISGLSPVGIARGPDGLFHMLVRINGVPVDMVVDTGASRTILSDDDARRVFPNESGELQGRITTFAGERDLRLQTAASVEIMGREFGRLDAGLVDGAPVSVIGLDWLALVGPITIAAGA